jgi:hypothetical protein
MPLDRLLRMVGTAPTIRSLTHFRSAANRRNKRIAACMERPAAFP